MNEEKKQRRRLRVIIDVAVVILVLLVGLALVLQENRRDSLEGTWEAGEILVEFNGQGKGVWMQGDHMEKIRYKIEKSTLTIQSDHDHPEKVYTFSLEGQTLTLTDETDTPLCLERVK